MIRIDGSYGEGGGQIIRTAASLAAILKKDIEIINVRAKRDPPGLKHQHLAALKSLDLFGIDVDANIGSTKVIIKGRKFSFPSRKDYVIEVGTAGSSNLIAQTIMPILAYYNIKTKIKIIGGTDVIYAPSSLWMQHIFIPYLKQVFGVYFDYMLIKKGYYPKGNGLIELKFKKAKWQFKKPYLFDNVIIHICEHTPVLKNVCERSHKIVEHTIGNIIKENRVFKTESEGINGLLWIRNSLGGIDWIGSKGKRLEDILKNRIEEFKKMRITLNPHNKWLCDQIMLWYYIYGLKTENSWEYECTNISQHTLTNAHIINKISESSSKIVIEHKKLKLNY